MASACYTTQQALTRPRNDPFHQVDDMRITSYSARYYLNPPAANCPTTFPVNATTRIQKSGNAWVEGQWKTDVESDLKGINRLGTKIRCDSVQYNPDTNTMNSIPLSNAKDENVPMTFARLVDPPCTLRTTGWNRWQPLFHNPQETFETPFDFFIPSRDIDREKYNTHKEKSCFTSQYQPPISELGHEKHMYPQYPNIRT
jgi:hypothetical protein